MAITQARVGQHFQPSGESAPVIVVGAGPSGLTAAFRLQNAGRAVVVIDAAQRIGGKLETIRQDGFLMETGALLVPSSYEYVIKLAEEIGVSDELIAASSIGNIWADNGMHTFDIASLSSVARSKVLSARSKLVFSRALPDMVRMRTKMSYSDTSRIAVFDGETAQQYCERKLNREIFDRIIDPTLRGIIGSRGDVLSYVSFMFNSQLFGAKLSVWRNGYGSFCERLAKNLDVRLGVRAVKVTESRNGVEVAWTAADGSTQSTRGEACVLAVDGKQVPELFGQLHPASAQFLRNLSYTTLINLNVALSRRPPLPGLSVLPTPSSGSRLMTVSLEHNITGRAPVGKGLVGIYADSDWSAELMDADDAEVTSLLLAEAEGALPGIGGDMEFTRISRRHSVIMVGRPGGCSGLRLLHERIPPESRVRLAGDYHSYSCVNSAVAAGERAANEVLIAVGALPSPPHPGQWRRPSSTRSQNTTAVSPSTAASVTVAPSSTVRTIMSATTAEADDVGADAGLPDTADGKA